MATGQLTLGLAGAPVAKAKRIGDIGWKAVIVYPDGRTSEPVRKLWKSPEAARAYAVAWIKSHPSS
jgi:hypothetical protein